MSFTFSTSTNIGKVRALVGDTVEADSNISDEEIQVFLDLTSNDLYASAALALRNIISKLAAVAKSISAGNYSETTGSKINELSALAEKYEEKSLSTPADAQAEQILTDFNYREILQGRALRGETD